jgi:hypothetical protein
LGNDKEQTWKYLETNTFNRALIKNCLAKLKQFRSAIIKHCLIIHYCQSSYYFYFVAKNSPVINLDLFYTQVFSLYNNLWADSLNLVTARAGAKQELLYNRPSSGALN